MAESYRQDILLRAREIKPDSILALGPESKAIFAQFAAEYPSCCVDIIEGGNILAHLKDRGVYDLAFISDLLEYLDKTSAAAILASVRDIHSREMYAVVPIGNAERGARSQWEQSDMLGYGMSLHASYRQDGGLIHMYRYALQDYKVTPDWLNAKYWAHPELFNKFRW